MTPLEIIAYLQENPVTPALIPILKSNYIDADGFDEIDLQDLESFVFYQQNQLPNGRKKTIKNRTTKEIISEQMDKVSCFYIDIYIFALRSMKKELGLYLK